jgi:hypothetical protein
MEYNSDFSYDLKFGQMGEQVVADIVAGDKTEVKSERDLWVNSGNHFVETESRGKPSGICTTHAKYWSINFYKNNKFCFNITVTVKDLKEIVLKYKQRRVRGGDNNTSWGVLVPIKGIIECMS